jgi:hypothetical protein
VNGQETAASSVGVIPAEPNGHQRREERNPPAVDLVETFTQHVRVGGQVLPERPSIERAD